LCFPEAVFLRPMKRGVQRLTARLKPSLIRRNMRRD
jgi:hypothetical protein